MTSTETRKAGNNKRTLIVCLLCMAVVIAGVFAFMTATDRKDNVFTIGNVKAELWEDCDTDNDGTTEHYGPDDKRVEFEDTFPGETRTKAPYIKNTGTNPEWTYIEVTVPLIKQGTEPDTSATISIVAYASQVRDADTDTAASVWAAVKEAAEGETYNDAAASDFIPMFELNDISGDWQLMESHKSSDGNLHLLYTAGLLPAGAQTDTLFSSVTLVDSSKTAKPSTGDKVTVAFMAGNTLYDSVIVESASESIPAPVLPNGYDFWLTETNAQKFPTDSINIQNECYVEDNSSIVNKNYVVINAIQNDSRSYVIAGDGNQELPVKLMPANATSTAMINRNGTVETYIDKSYFATDEDTGYKIDVFKNKVIDPIQKPYGYNDSDYTNYILFGLDTNMNAGKLMNFVKVQGNGYGKVILTKYGVEGTEGIIEVYDASNDQLVEAFHIVIFGDLNGDSIVSAADINLERAEADGFITFWSIPGTSDYNKYRTLAADFSQNGNIDGNVDLTDVAKLRRVVAGLSEFNQVADSVQNVTYAIMGDEDETLPIKLMPVDADSTVMIKRNDIVESNNYDASDFTSDSFGNDVIAPNPSRIYDDTDFTNYILYGLDTDMYLGRLMDFVKVQGNGYAKVIATKLGAEGTDAVIEVRDLSDNHIVEVFHVVIFGDLDGDGLITEDDRTVLNNELSGTTSWSCEDEDEYNPYLFMAADINAYGGDGMVSSTDRTALYQVLNKTCVLDQVTGYKKIS